MAQPLLPRRTPATSRRPPRRADIQLAIALTTKWSDDPRVGHRVHRVDKQEWRQEAASDEQATAEREE
jgi:hypothetical protein